MSCQWQVGMLVVRTCGLPASGVCSFCGSQLCGMHTVMGADGPACPRCAASHQGYESNDDTEFARERDENYRTYGGAAKYGEDGYFTEQESAAMGASTYVAPPVVKKKKYDPKDS